MFGIKFDEIIIDRFRDVLEITQPVRMKTVIYFI